MKAWTRSPAKTESSSAFILPSFVQFVQGNTSLFEKGCRVCGAELFGGKDNHLAASFCVGKRIVRIVYDAKMLAGTIWKRN